MEQSFPTAQWYLVEGLQICHKGLTSVFEMDRKGLQVSRNSLVRNFQIKVDLSLTFLRETGIKQSQTLLSYRQWACWRYCVFTSHLQGTEDNHRGVLPHGCLLQWPAAEHTLSITEGTCAISGGIPLPSAHGACHSVQGTASWGPENKEVEWGSWLTLQVAIPQFWVYIDWTLLSLCS